MTMKIASLLNKQFIFTGRF